MPGYVLDTNHISAYFEQQPNLIARIRALPAETFLFVSAITLGEIEAGHRMNEPRDPNGQHARGAFVAFVTETFLPFTLSITDSTRSYYAQVMEALWRDCAPATRRTRTEYHLAHEFGVDINDVWIVASALEHNLTLVTQDAMERIVNVVAVRIESWL